MRPFFLGLAEAKFFIDFPFTIKAGVSILKTAPEYIESVRELKPRVYLNGRRVDSILENPVTKTVVDSMAKVYEMTQDPAYQNVMTAYSPLIKDRISRCVHIFRSKEDLEKRVEMAILTSQVLGTCNYRCPACDGFNALASVTYEMDKKLGASYNKRFLEYLRWVQANDIACNGSLTDVKGDRSKRPKEQDPDMYLRVVEKEDDGIVVRGARIHQSGAIAAEEAIILPGVTFRKGEEEYAIAFAVPNGTKGLTYVCQFVPEDAERLLAEDTGELGNPIYGIRETCVMVFDNVFVPWERVFMCGEVEFTMSMWSRFAKTHRMTCGGACKVGFGDLMIGAAQTMAEYLGTEGAPHIREKITEMVKINETLHACALASAFKGSEEPPRLKRVSA